MERPSGERYVGLISGTSMDGIDAVAVDFSGSEPAVLAALTHAFDADLTDGLDAVRRDPDGFPVAALGKLDATLGDALAEATLAVLDRGGLEPAQISAVGSHGQTVVHHPEARPPFTLQIGDPWRLARQTGITTVADFRRADLAAGGQGAPLAPLLHDAVFRHSGETRLVANLGGIANLTVLQPGEDLGGFDSGPANCLLDLWYRRHHFDARYDRSGVWAASGRVDEGWLDALMDDPYLQQAPPKSTGIEYFSPAWLEARLPEWAGERPADVQATLAEFSAKSLAQSVARVAPPSGARLLVCGGGVHNDDLLDRLRRHLPGVGIESTAEHGLDPDLVEAVLFAWLAQRRLAGEAVDTRSLTGARHPVHLGAVIPA
ncbi:MAG: anhydro-N-acetylmuramic acid kinase [Gammaproteobacteria bacterium]|jgi:anhydro-N-acetylmuramic acid kinase|nr:anhydro-N-acetylmuramic acid kinase [Gammaproteobacteria bacterium]